MKSGQKTKHETVYFNCGLGGKSGSWRDWLNMGETHKKAKNISRNKKRKK